ncbi:MAG: hypothetical protein V8S10_09060 [Clostridia bacterium]|nr:MAG TPA: hypothetical protein [Caudoviricetes sp.]
MKENSREDRINNAYCFLNSMHSDFRTGLYYKEDLENLEHILSDYKRVLKENEELNLKYYMLYTGKIENLKAQEVKIKSQVIPVQKVKDKIEELQKGPLKINENNKYYYETEAYNKIIIQVLQELLEGRK